MRRVLIAAVAVFTLAFGAGVAMQSNADPCQPICAKCVNGREYFCCQCNPNACWFIDNGCSGP